MSIPSTLTLVIGTMSGAVIVVPTPVVLGFPVVPSSIEDSVPPYKSVPPCPLTCPAVTPFVAVSGNISVLFPFASTVNLLPSVTIP